MANFNHIFEYSNNTTGSSNNHNHMIPIKESNLL